MKRLQALCRRDWTLEYDRLYPEKNGGNAWGLCDEDTKTIIIDPFKHETAEEMWDTFLHEYLHVAHPRWAKRHDLIHEGVKKAMRQDRQSWQKTPSLENAVPQLQYLVEQKFRVIVSGKPSIPGAYDINRHTIVLNPLLHETDDDLLESLIVNYVGVRYPNKDHRETKKTTAVIISRMRGRLAKQHQ